MSERRARPKLSRDFYSELIKSSQAPRAGFLAERERWLRSVSVEGREELLFELEMLLRGLERYFNLHNLFIDARSRPVVTRDFRVELADVRHVLGRIVRLARQLLNPDADQKMVFRKYVETQLTDDRVRRALLEEELDQDSPQESLFVLRESFVALKGLAEHLLKLESISYQLFSDVGSLALKDIVLNRFFRPFRPLEFRLEYDRVKSVALLELLRVLPSPQRQAFTVLSLALFRLLHYLSYVGDTEKAPRLGRARVVLALVRSELTSLVRFLSADFVEQLSSRKHQAFALRMAKELSAKTDRIFERLHGAPAEEAGPLLAAAVELTALFRRQLERVAKVLGGEDALTFDALVSGRSMARRLQVDLWALAELCRATEESLRAGDAGDADGALGRVRELLSYFQDVSYQLLRYGDFEPFDRFIAIISERPSAPPGPVGRDRLADDCRRFGQVARHTFSSVSRRSEVTGSAFDKDAARALLARFQ